MAIGGSRSKFVLDDATDLPFKYPNRLVITQSQDKKILNSPFGFKHSANSTGILQYKKCLNDKKCRKSVLQS